MAFMNSKKTISPSVRSQRNIAKLTGRNTFLHYLNQHDLRFMTFIIISLKTTFLRIFSPCYVREIESTCDNGPIKDAIIRVIIALWHRELAPHTQSVVHDARAI